MSTLSLRSLPKDLERAIREEARRSGKTKTEIVIFALQNLFQLGSKSQKRAKIQSFFGKMTPEDLKRFEKTVAPFSDVEPDLWK